MFGLYIVLLFSLSLSARANEQTNRVREALPLCPGHETNVLSITGYTLQLLPGNDVLEGVVTFNTSQLFTAHWLTVVRKDDFSVTLFNLKDSDEFVTINEFLPSQRQGRSIFKAKWSAYQNAPIFLKQVLEILIHRDNGLDVVLYVDMSEGEVATLTEDQLLTNQRFQFNHSFAMKQLPPTEYSGDTSDCKMEMILFSSPPRENSQVTFLLKSLRDYPPWLAPSARNMSFHHEVTPEEDEDRIKATLIFVPDSNPDSARYEPLGYALTGSLNRESPLGPVSVMMAVRKAPVTTTVLELKTEIVEGFDLIETMMIGRDGSPTLNFLGSTPGQLACLREYSGPGPKTMRVYIQVAGRSSVPRDLRWPTSRVIQASSGGVLELSYFPLRNPAWVLAHKTRCRCVHRLAGGRVLASPWREVKLA